MLHEARGFRQRASPRARSLGGGDTLAPLWAVVGLSEHFAIGRICFISADKGESQSFHLNVSFRCFCKTFPTQDTLLPRRGEATTPL
jgi:hypothetical protein